VRTRLSCEAAVCGPRPEVARGADALIPACLLAGAHTSPGEGKRGIRGHASCGVTPIVADVGQRPWRQSLLRLRQHGPRAPTALPPTMARPFFLRVALVWPPSVCRHARRQTGSRWPLSMAARLRKSASASACGAPCCAQGTTTHTCRTPVCGRMPRHSCHRFQGAPGQPKDG
jgi:hypothetical protein